MSNRSRGRRSARGPISRQDPQQDEEEARLPDHATSESISSSCTTSHPSSPRSSSPRSTSTPSSATTSPSKRGFVRLDRLLKKSDKTQENFENSTMAIAALAALSSGGSALIPSLDSRIKAKLEKAKEGQTTKTTVAPVEGSGHLTISLVGAKRRPRRVTKRTKIYTF